MICFRYLIEHGAQMGSRDKQGWAAIHKAAWGGHARTLHTLIELGADINATSNHGTTALHLAAARNDGKVCNLLINNRARVSDQAISYTGACLMWNLL